MRKTSGVRAALLCAVLAFAPGASPPTPLAVTYVLGGVVSGPYRLSADLRAGTAEEARPPPGRLGDGARMDPWTMHATSRRKLTEADRRLITGLAATLLSDGITDPARCPATAPPPPPDALVAFAVTLSGSQAPARLSAPAQCLSDSASRLQRVLHDAAQP